MSSLMFLLNYYSEGLPPFNWNDVIQLHNDITYARSENETCILFKAAEIFVECLAVLVLISSQSFLEHS